MFFCRVVPWYPIFYVQDCTSCGSTLYLHHIWYVFPFGRKNTEPIVWNLNYVVFICRFWYWTCFNSKRPELFLFLPERANPIALVAFAHQDGVNKLECIIYWMVIPKNKVEHNWNHSILGWVFGYQTSPIQGFTTGALHAPSNQAKVRHIRTLGRAHENNWFQGILW